MQIKVDISEALQKLKAMSNALSKEDNTLALARALNRTVQKSRTLSNREIRKEYNIKAADINKTFDVQKASRTNLDARLNSTGAALPLHYFAPRKVKTGVTVSIIKGKRDRIERAFFLPNKKIVVARGRYSNSSFEFRTKRAKKRGSDTPISKLLTASVPHAFASQNVQEQFVPPLQVYLAERLETELNYLLSKAGK
jgi:hypothetical protein